MVCCAVIAASEKRGVKLAFYNRRMSEADEFSGAPRPSKPSFRILGLTSDQRLFRPSDWAERLAGIMANFDCSADEAAASIAQSHLASSGGYSSLVLPIFLDHAVQGTLQSLRAVEVNARLHDVEPLAYEFLRRFAIDNDLITILLESPSSGSNKP